MKISLLIFAILLWVGMTLNAQTISSFEDLSLPADTFWNGSDTSGGFISGNAFFINDYNPQWGSWSGFSYSSMTDSITQGYVNEYSAIAATGYNSATYAVAYVSSFGGPTYISLKGAAKGKEVSGFYITNSTYAYLSMQYGDMVSKRFGGVTGNDPDWFKVKINGYLNGVLTDTIDFYLADFRAQYGSQDYLVRTWEWVDCTPLGAVDSLTFELSSSDVGSWGMNTPAYFCMDNFTTTDGVGFQENELLLSTTIYPNPAENVLFIRTKSTIQLVEIYSLTGELLVSKKLQDVESFIEISYLAAGAYFVRISDNENTLTQKFIKK